MRLNGWPASLPAEAADLFSGIILYQTLCGVHPFGDRR
jgi:hypothetical protein